MSIEDENFNNVFQFEKLKELWDWSTLEVRMASIGTIVMVFICALNITLGEEEQFVNFLASAAKDIGIAFIGFLGFIVTGLAILTGSISSKVVCFFKEKNVYDRLKGILNSFYFLGLLTGILIVGLFGEYFISQISVSSNKIVIEIIVAVTTYLIIYVVFYAIGLTGNCISIFEIITDIEGQIDKEDKNYKQIYDSYRIIALEHLILKSDSSKKICDYEKKIEELILRDSRTSEEQKKKIISIKNKHFDK